MDLNAKKNPTQPQVNEDQYQYDTIITAGKLLDEIIPMKLPKEVGEYLVQAHQILWKFLLIKILI